MPFSSMNGICSCSPCPQKRSGVPGTEYSTSPLRKYHAPSRVVISMPYGSTMPSTDAGW
jgi:hypothetical protein